MSRGGFHRRLQRGIQPAERDRRGAIRYALFERIRDKGYAATSLADVAAAAGISASHLLYYYPSKDAVLEDLFDVATKNMRADVAEFPWQSVDEAIDAIGDYFLGGRAFSSTEQATMLQFWGLSTHYVRLRQTKAEFDADMLDRLTDLFQRTKRPTGLPPRDAAEAVFGLLTGLLSTSYFVKTLDLSRARTVFGHAARRLLGRKDRNVQRTF